NSLGLWLAYTWALGMGIMSFAMHMAGLKGAPRRSTFSEYGGHELAQEWISYQLLQAIGGSFLLIAIIIAFFAFFLSLRTPKFDTVEVFTIALFIYFCYVLLSWVDTCHDD